MLCRKQASATLQDMIMPVVEVLFATTWVLDREASSTWRSAQQFTAELLRRFAAVQSFAIKQQEHYL